MGMKLSSRQNPSEKIWVLFLQRYASVLTENLAKSRKKRPHI